METKQSVFAVLNAINCNDHTEKKNGLTYLSWAWAWQIVKQNFPEANYKVYKNPDGWNYWTDGRTAWVETGVTINGLEHTDHLPVMDSRNRSLPLESITSFDVNKAIQRSLTKCCARHGLGLYIYAGEDLPDAADDTAREEVKKARKKPAPVPLTRAAYYQIVKAYAEGQFTKTGGDYRETWILNYKPSPEEVTQFDLDVQDYRAAKQDGKLG